MEALVVIIAVTVLFTFLTRILFKYLSNGYVNKQFGTNLGDKHWEKLNRYEGDGK